jgi:hypothetical protein
MTDRHALPPEPGFQKRDWAAWYRSPPRTALRSSDLGPSYRAPPIAREQDQSGVSAAVSRSSLQPVFEKVGMKR